jgi:N-acetylneuraminic acid mutarotase
MSTPRLGHTATLLPNGDVLVAGGSTTVDEQSPSDSAEIYDPSQGTWSATGSMNSPRTNHAALSLTNGDVLVSSGFDTDAAERYDPSTGTWTTISSPGDQATVGANLMTLLPNGGVLAILSYLPQLYDPSANAWTPTSPIPGVDPESGPFPFNLTSMKDGTVLIAGGIIYPGGPQTDFPPVNTAYLYQPSTDTWNATGNLTTARDAAIARLLQDGTVLVFGGTSDASSELFDASTDTWSATGTMVTARSTRTEAPAVLVLSDGKVLVTGGISVGNNSNVLANTEIYNP